MLKCDFGCFKHLSNSKDRLGCRRNCEKFSYENIRNNIQSVNSVINVDTALDSISPNENVHSIMVTNCSGDVVENSNVDLSVICDYNDGAISVANDSSQTMQNVVNEISVNSCVKHFNEDLSKFSKTNVKNMIFSHLNVNSMSCKFMEIHELLVKGYSDILFLSETKLDMSFPDAQFHIDKFLIHRIDRNVHGGGLVCYIKETIPHKNRTDIAINQNGIESLVIQVKIHHKNMFFLHIYKPPNVNVIHLNNALETMLNNCFSESDSIFVVGDLNVNFKLNPNQLSNICDSYDLKQIIKGPTCFKNVDNPTLLDVILTNAPRSVKQSINISLGISDFHNYISASTKIACPSDEPKTVHYRTFKNFNEVFYRNDLETAPFHVSNVFDDVDDQLWFHNTLLLDVIDKHAPKKQKTIKHKQLPYMNDRLRKAINVKAALRRKYQKFKSRESWQNFKKQRNLVNKLKRSSLAKYFEENCNASKTKGKHFWDVVKPFMTNNVKRNNQNITLYEQDSLISTPTDVSNTFNEYFINITNDLGESEEVRQMSTNEVIDLYKDHPSIKLISKCVNKEEYFNFRPVSQPFIRKQLELLHPNKATGFDRISPKFLKLGSNSLSGSLTPIINKSITVCKFPEYNKKAEVTPLYKKSDQLAKENYRPLSVLPSTSKIFEKVLCDQLLNFMSSYMSNDLSAYRKLYSCNNVLVKCIENWRKALDENCHVGCILIDLSKAFDSLPHGLLIAKLHAYGVSLEACSYIMNYLKNRRQAVKLGNVRSEWLNLKTGVPQGSIMGPLLFNIFINDFILDLKETCYVYNYADDNTLSYMHEDKQTVKNTLEKAAEKAITWFEVNYMKANPSKFQALCISRENAKLEFKINDNTIESDKIVKLLGIHIDDKLNFNHHLSLITKKAARQINALQRLCKYVDYDCRLRIYEAFVASNFVYCSIAYHTFSMAHDRKIEKLNERALRLVCNDYTNTYNNLLLRTNKKMLHVICKNNVVEFVFKVLNNLAPPLENTFFDKQISPYDMRDNFKLVQPSFNTVQYGKKSIRYQGPSLWNALPSHVKCLEDKASFKSELYKNDYFNHCECGVCLLCLRNSL